MSAKNEKYCFIIMPISDNAEYPEGHFNRVYEHLIIPACETAGFIPIRADDVINTNYIALDVIRKIIESEMVLCDLSSQNPNVLYELGIRQAFNKPVSLIKDRKTKRIFDIQGFRDFVYDETLRVDSVQSNIEELSQVLVSTYEENSDNINSLVSLLSLNPAKIVGKAELTNDTKLILNSISGLEKRIATIESNVSSPQDMHSIDTIKHNRGSSTFTVDNTELPENVGEEFSPEELENLKKGNHVYHKRFGFGEVLRIERKGSSSKNITAEVKFMDNEVKFLILRFSRFRKVL